MSTPGSDITPAPAACPRDDLVAGIEDVIARLRTVRAASEDHRADRLMDRALEHLTDAQAIARREHHS